MIKYDITLLARNHSLSTSIPSALWYNQSKILYTPVPLNSDILFTHFASTFAENSGNTYLYHQLSDSIVAEELWDDYMSGF